MPTSIKTRPQQDPNMHQCPKKQCLRCLRKMCPNKHLRCHSKRCHNKHLSEDNVKDSQQQTSRKRSPTASGIYFRLHRSEDQGIDIPSCTHITTQGSPLSRYPPVALIFTFLFPYNICLLDSLFVTYDTLHGEILHAQKHCT